MYTHIKFINVTPFLNALVQVHTPRVTGAEERFHKYRPTETHR